MRYLRRALAGLAVFVGGLVGVNFVEVFAAVLDWRNTPSFRYRLCQVFFPCCWSQNEHRNIQEHFCASKDRRAARRFATRNIADVSVFVGMVKGVDHYGSLHARTQKRNGPQVPAFAGGNA
jgi:hypothetical protein